MFLTILRDDALRKKMGDASIQVIRETAEPRSAPLAILRNSCGLQPQRAWSTPTISLIVTDVVYAPHETAMLKNGTTCRM